MNRLNVLIFGQKTSSCKTIGEFFRPLKDNMGVNRCKMASEDILHRALDACLHRIEYKTSMDGKEPQD